MIVLLTNRVITGNSFGNVVEASPHTLHLATVDPGEPDKILRFNFDEEFSDEVRFEFSPSFQIVRGDVEANLQNLSRNVPQKDQGKPWVFFVHGFNQSIDKNLTKCALLESIHDVNIFAFSWPSRPSVPMDKMGMVNAVYKFIKNPTLLTALKSTLVEFIEWKQEVYSIARSNAEGSVDALNHALGIAFQNFFQNINSPKTLLIHSLGNYLGELYFKKYGPQRNETWFENIIFHQGDAIDDTHPDWINSDVVKCVKNDIIVTQNKKDAVLISSELEKFVYQGNVDDSARRRMGRGDGETLSRDLRVRYIDFTKAPMVGFDHNFFNLAAFDNVGANYIMNRLLRSKPFDQGYLKDYVTTNNRRYTYKQPVYIEDSEYF